MKRVAALALAGMAAVAAWGAPVAEWEHVGRITGTDGKPLTGEQALEVRLYGSMTATEPLWGRKATALLDADGNFSLRLGDALEPLDGTPTNSLESVLAAGPVFAEATARGGAMIPRAVVAATPYVLFAAGAEESVGDFGVEKDLTVGGAATVSAFSAESADAGGDLAVADTLAVDGNLTAGGGIKVPGLDGPVPIGTIVLFHGTNLPPCWALCDGSVTANGIQTPDLRGYFVVGAGGNYASGERGGAPTVALDPTNLPPHSHTYSRLPQGGAGRMYSTTMPKGQTAPSGSAVGPDGNPPDGGFGQPHNNLPPFIALDYIMRVE